MWFKHEQRWLGQVSQVSHPTFKTNTQLLEPFQVPLNDLRFIVGQFLAGWWLSPTPLKNMTSSVGMIIIPNWMEQQKSCSKPPTRYHIFLRKIHLFWAPLFQIPWKLCFFQPHSRMWPKFGDQNGANQTQKLGVHLAAFIECQGQNDHFPPKKMGSDRKKQMTALWTGWYISSGGQMTHFDYPTW